MNKKNLIKGTLLGLMGLVLICTNSAMAEEPCTITIDGNIEYIEYGDSYGDYLYSQESSKECYNYEEIVRCDNEGDDLGNWYSSCEFQHNSPTVLENGDLQVCGIEYISDSNGAAGCITIQGKNVGATTTGAGPSAYGNYYQWGDNTVYTTSNWNSSNIQPDNAWGGGSDNNGLVYPVENGSERQGPCDPGYHVPSQGEWYALIDMWEGSSANGEIDGYYISQFLTEFQIPFAGYINSDGSIWDTNYYYIELWSSSPYVDDDVDDDEYKRAKVFYAIGYENAGADNSQYRTYGYPVRCFKNSPYSTSNLPSEDEDGLITVNIAALNGGQNTCSLDNYIFSGIFASPSVVFKNISQSMHCIFGDAGSKAVTLELSGNLTDGSGNIIPGGNVRLKNSAWIATPSGIQTGNTAIAEYTGLNQTITLFNKVANKIGEATGAGVDIQIEVPGGTPNGVYNGVLVLSY